MVTSDAPKPEQASTLAPWQLWIKLLRPKQWTKNLIVFAAALFSAHLFESQALLSATACFTAFCLVSGSLYVLNDVLDSNSDRAHPIKCKRPIASGAIKPGAAIAFALGVGTAGLVLAFLVRPAVFAVVLAYVLIQLAYIYSLKHQVLIDIGCISTGFVLRAVAGAVAVHVAASSWFLLCTALGSLFIALEKRRQELKLLGKQASSCRPVLASYCLESINRLEAMILPSLIFAYMLYTVLSYHGQWMMLTIPFVLYGAARYIKVSNDGDMTAAPEDVLLKDAPIQATLVLWIITSMLVVYGTLPKVMTAFATYLDSLGHGF